MRTTSSFMRWFEDLLTSDVYSTDIVMIGMSIVIAVYLLVPITPVNTQVFTHSVLTYFTERDMGVYITLVFLFRIIALILHNVLLRMTSYALGSVWWCYLGAILLIDFPASINGPWCLVLGVASLWAMWRMAAESYEEVTRDARNITSLIGRALRCLPFLR